MCTISCLIPGYVWKESEVLAGKVLLRNTEPFLGAAVAATADDIPAATLSDSVAVAFKKPRAECHS